MNLLRSKARALGALVSVGLLASGWILGVGPTAAWSAPAVVIEGKGYGHGRGLSQYGSLGYALMGRGHQWILDHYYSNTTMGNFSDNTTIGVSLEGSVNKDMIVVARNAYNVGGFNIPTHVATMVRRVAPNTFDIFTANNCAGSGGWNKIGSRTGDVVASPPSINQGNDLNLMLEHCLPGVSRAYRGHLTMIDDGSTRVINNVSLGGYLRGVLPREVPASWANLAHGGGSQALFAQAVAARSYAISSPRPRWTTCDTISCQVYGGAFLNGQYIEDGRTDTAVASTSGQVRILNGTVARTEFSSSSGGYTAGGTFPAVVDEGDSVTQNPNHNWSTSVPHSAIQNAYPAIGSFSNITINSRNGLGDWGGRVTSMTVAGSSGSVTVSGADFRAKLGLKSDWIRVAGTPSGGIDGYWLSGSDGGIFTYGNIPYFGSAGNIRLQRPIVGSAPMTNGAGYWLVASDGGIFTYGNAGFFGSTGAMRLNQPVVGMAAAPANDGYWLVASDGGIFTFGNAPFAGSTGDKRLNQPIVGMAATPSGKGYWLVAADGGVFTFGDATFYGSTGDIRLSAPIAGIAPTPDGKGYWMVATDGGTFSFGNAGYFGSLPGSGIRGQQATSITSTATGKGYIIATLGGNVYSYGDAPWMGGLGGGYRGRIVGVMGHRQ